MACQPPFRTIRRTLWNRRSPATRATAAPSTSPSFRYDQYQSLSRSLWSYATSRLHNIVIPPRHMRSPQVAYREPAANQPAASSSPRRMFLLILFSPRKQKPLGKREPAISGIPPKQRDVLSPLLPTRPDRALSDQHRPRFTDRVGSGRSGRAHLFQKRSSAAIRKSDRDVAAHGPGTLWIREYGPRIPRAPGTRATAIRIVERPTFLEPERFQNVLSLFDDRADGIAGRRIAFSRQLEVGRPVR